MHMTKNFDEAIFNLPASNELLEMHNYEGKRKKEITIDLEYDIYVVKPLDTIESVAALFKMTPSKICHINKLTMRTLFINQKLKVIKQKEIDDVKLEEEKYMEASKQAEITESLDNLPFSGESILFPIHYKGKYMKVNAKYITDTQGIINGKLHLTPVALTFNPGFKDSVVQEYGFEKFTIHLPNNKIACVSMYNDSAVMAYKRSQRTMCNQIINPRQHTTPIFTCQDDDDNSPSDFISEILHNRKLSLIEEDINEQNNINNKLLLSLSTEQAQEAIYFTSEYSGEAENMRDHNYLCVIASPRYKKTKAIYQKEDEYWFMVPVDSTDSVLEFLLVNGQNKYDTGANVDAQSTWPDEKNGESPKNPNQPNRKKLVKSSSFSKVDSFHKNLSDLETSGKFSGYDLLREKSMDWEIINNDFDITSLSTESLYAASEFGESNIIDKDQIKTLLAHVPSQAVGAKWDLIYSTMRNGWSLKTLYRNVFDSTRNSCILLVKDTESNIFGAFCNNYIRISKAFYGNGLTFLFRWHPEFEKFNCTLKNTYILYGDPDYFVVGSENSKNAIRLHRTLFDGISQACGTFDSPPLTNTEFFQISMVEVWSFY